MSDSCVIIIAQYEEPIDEWFLLSLRSRWGGIERLRSVAWLARDAWNTHEKNRMESAPEYMPEYAAKLLGKLMGQSGEMYWHSIALGETLGADHDYLVIDLTTLTAFMVPSDVEGYYTAIRAMLRNKNGDRIALKDLDEKFVKDYREKEES